MLVNIINADSLTVRRGFMHNATFWGFVEGGTKYKFDECVVTLDGNGKDRVLGLSADTMEELSEMLTRCSGAALLIVADREAGEIGVVEVDNGVVARHELYSHGGVNASGVDALVRGLLG